MASRIFLWLAAIGAVVTCLLALYTYMGGKDDPAMGLIVWILGGLLYVVPSAMVTAVFFVFGMVLRQAPSGELPAAAPVPGNTHAIPPSDVTTIKASRTLGRRLILAGVALVLVWLGYIVTSGGVLGFARFGLLPLFLSLGLILGGLILRRENR